MFGTKALWSYRTFVLIPVKVKEDVFIKAQNGMKATACQQKV